MLRCLFFGVQGCDDERDRQAIGDAIARAGGFELVPVERPHRTRQRKPSSLTRLVAGYHDCHHVLEAWLVAWGGRLELATELMTISPNAARGARRESAVCDETRGMRGLLDAIDDAIAKLVVERDGVPPGPALTVGQRLAIARHLADASAIAHLTTARDAAEPDQGQLRVGDAVDIRVGAGIIPGIALEQVDGRWRVLCGTVEALVDHDAVAKRVGPGSFQMPPGVTLLIGDGTPRFLHLPDGTHSLGRHPSNDVALDDKIASQRHAVITVDNGVASLSDARSMSGTTVNGERVQGEHPLAVGDDIALGQTDIHVLG
jgi:FHA domain